MIYIAFWHDQEDTNQIFHCGIFNENREAISIWTPYAFHGFKMYGVCGLVTVFKLPVSFNSLLNKRRQLSTLRYPSRKFIARNPIDFPFNVYTKKEMSCSQLAAYLLGLDEFWYYKPNDVYEVISRYAKPMYYKLNINRWVDK